MIFIRQKPVVLSFTAFACCFLRSASNNFGSVSFTSAVYSEVLPLSVITLYIESLNWASNYLPELISCCKARLLRKIPSFTVPGSSSSIFAMLSSLSIKLLTVCVFAKCFAKVARLPPSAGDSRPDLRPCDDFGGLDSPGLLYDPGVMLPL